ncbi:hypothetical protein ACFLQR_03695 [Verrucomicrobiota bacterium]
MCSIFVQGKAANPYVLAKCAWNTDLDVDGLLKDYCEGRYGRVAGPMYEYLTEAENQSRVYLKYFVKNAEAKKKQAESLAQCQGWLDEAKARATGEQAKKNIAAEEANIVKLKKFNTGK